MKLVFEPDDHARYVRGLNECFPGWGGDPLYRWVFARSASAPPPERLVFTDDAGDWLAGTGISFRTIRHGDERHLCGVMTGSWTLPAARGKGLFPAFIQETRKRVMHHGGVAVIAFSGDMQRASTRKLLDAGSRCVTTTNAVGEIADAPATIEDVALDVRAITDADTERLYARWRARTVRATGFDYADHAAFAGQFVHRACEVDVVEGPADAIGAIERGPDTDRVLFLDEGESDRQLVLRALWARAARRGRKLYAFGMGAEAERVFAGAGLAARPGVFTILPSDEGAENAALADDLARASWDQQSGDRI